MSIFILLFLSGCNIFDTKMTNPNPKPTPPQDAAGEYKGYKIPTTPEGYILVNEDTFPDTKKEEQEKIDRARELVKLLEGNEQPVRKSDQPKDSTPDRVPPKRTPQVSPQNNSTPTQTPIRQDVQPDTPKDSDWQTKSKQSPDNIPQQEPIQEQPTEDFIFIPTDVWVNMNSQNYPEE